MKSGYRKMWWGVPCASRKSMRTESIKDIEEILKDKLPTIEEEPKICDENWIVSSHLRVSKKGKKIGFYKAKMRGFIVPQFSLKGYYLVFINGVSPRGRVAGLPQP